MNEYINRIIQGDALEILKTFPDEFVDLIVTSPPYYNLRDYGKEEQIGLEPTREKYIERILLVTKELKRVLKKSGQLWLNLGDSYGSHRDWTCSDDTRKAKISRLQKGDNPKCLNLIPERIAIKMTDEQGWILRNKVKWAKSVLIKQEMDTIGNCMPTSVRDRFNESGEEFYFFVKSQKYYANLNAVKLPYKASTYDRYTRKVNPSKADVQSGVRYTGLRSFQLKLIGVERFAQLYSLPSSTEIKKNEDELTGKNLPTIWQINSRGYSFKKEVGVGIEHYATFPESLIDIPIRFGCPEGGIVLDPFMGSGTTAVVSKKLERCFIGIELNEDYIKIAQERINNIPDSLFSYK